MARVKWDTAGEHFYEVGVDHGMFYPSTSNGYGKGEAWNGLTSFTKSPEGAEPTKIYADNINYLNLLSAEDFNGSIGCYTYPAGFRTALGYALLNNIPGVTVGQQSHKPFGFCCRTNIGNDTDGQDHGYKLHLVYGVLASPSEEAYNTINDSPEAIEFSYDITGTPVDMPASTGLKPSAILEIDSRDFVTEAAKARLQALEDYLYGVDPNPEDPEDEGSEPAFPTPSQVIDFLKEPSPNVT